MSPSRRTKGQSGESAPAAGRVENAHGAPEHTIATKAGSSSAAPQESPRKKQATGISMSQKQALVDNLQLESM